MKKRNGFTLVELLAVIVILAIILVIAVPTIMNTIDNARLGAFQSSAKLIAASAEREYLVQETLGETNISVDCDDVADTTSDYSYCQITFDDDGKASVKLQGAGKFDGYGCTAATRSAADTCEKGVTVDQSGNNGDSGNTDNNETATPDAGE